MTDTPTHLFSLRLIIYAILIWSVIHAVGAYAHDPRRALVIGCTASGFLIFWTVVLRVGRSRTAAADSGPEEVPISRACVVGFTLSLISVGLVVCLLFGAYDGHTALLVMLAALLTTTSSVTAAIVGLSDPAPRHGKGLGISVFVLLALLFVGVMVHVVITTA